VSTSLAPVRIDGWTLFQGSGAHWIRDLDLADQAELKNTRDIRTHIKKAVDDGALTIVADGDNGSGPLVRVEKTMVPIGSGAHREVDEYYLNEEAALVIITRLRTPAAVQLTRTICRVFFLVSRGEFPQARTAPELSTRRAELYLRIVELLPADTCQAQRLANLAYASAELSGQRPQLPEATQRFRRTADIALELDVTIPAVSKAVAALGLKEREGMCRMVEDLRAHGHGVCQCPEYTDEAVEEIREWLAAQPATPAKRSRKGAPAQTTIPAAPANDAREEGDDTAA